MPKPRANTDAYPLHWPPGWPRTPLDDRADGRHTFRKSLTSSVSPYWTFTDARDELFNELHRLGAANVVLSSNIKPNGAGMLIEPNRRPADQGLAVYFTLDGQAKTMARDIYLRIEENMRALALTIAALRSIERHGGGQMMNRAFAGFTALPPPDGSSAAPAGKPWWHVLDITPSASELEVKAAYRAAAKVRHPDAGGSSEAMAELQAAYDAALREVAQ